MFYGWDVLYLDLDVALRLPVGGPGSLGYHTHDPPREALQAASRHSGGESLAPGRVPRGLIRKHTWRQRRGMGHQQDPKLQEGGGSMETQNQLTRKTRGTELVWAWVKVGLHDSWDPSPQMRRFPQRHPV